MIRFPYPGLRPFLQEESEIFFGREAQVDALLERLSGTRFLGIVGPSGCGKSSLVLAGMINALRAGFLSGAGARWRIATMRPGTRPLYRLAEGLCRASALGEERAGHPAAAAMLRATLSRGPLGLVEALEETPLPERTNLLVLADQFEELFRYGLDSDPDEATAFVDLLLTTAAHPHVPVYVVLTMRSDFLGDCTVFHGLPEAMNESQFLTPRLTREQQRAAIVGPAHLFESTVEPALVNHILNDMGPDPDQLPLMQHALMRVWVRAAQLSTGTFDTRDLDPARIQETEEEEEEEAPAIAGPQVRRLHLTVGHYQAVGGLQYALSRHADKVYNQLSEEGRRIAEVLFRRLTERGSSHRDTRRPTRLGEVAEVAGVEAREVIAVVEAFRRPGRSFVTPPAAVPLAADSLLDISHESLIRQWKRLSGWVESEARSAENYYYLEETARRWDENRRTSEDGSWGQSDLWRGSNLDRALEWRAEQRPTAQWASRYGGRFELAMEFLDTSERERQRQEDLRRAEAEKERRAEADRRLAEVQRLFTKRRLKTLRLWGAIATVLALLAGLLGTAAWVNLRKVRQLEQERDLARQALNEVKSRPTVGLLLAAEAMERHPDDHPDHVSVGESSLRKVLATVFSATELPGHDGGVRAIRFVPGASRVATASASRIYLWDLAAEPLAARELATHSGAVHRLLVSAGGRWLAAVDVRRLLLWELTGAGRALAPVEHPDEILTAAFDPRGVRIATAGFDGSVRIYGLSSGAPELERVLAHRDPVQAIAFSGDGTSLATASWDSDVAIWDLEREEGTPRAVPERDAWYLSFDPRAPRIAAASRGAETLSIWSVDAAAAPRRWLEVQRGSSLQGIEFGPHGRWLVAWTEDGTAWLWDVEAAPGVEAGSRSFRLRHRGHVNSVAFSADGAWLATSDSRDHVRIWDLGAEDPAARPLRLPHTAVSTLAFSPDGERLGTGGPGESARVWNLAHRPAAPVVLPVDNDAAALGISPDGRWLAAASGREILLWSLPDLSAAPGGSRDPLRPAHRLRHGDDVLALAFSPPPPDRPVRWLAAGGYDRKATLWDLERPEKAVRVIDHQDTVTQLAFDDRARWLASGAWAGRVRVASLEDPGAAPLEHSFHGDVEALLFHAQGDRLIVVAQGAAFDWPLAGGADPPELAQSVTRIAASRGGEWLATLRHEQWIDLRHAGRLLNPALSLRQERVIALGFGSEAANGWRWLATASDDRQVRVWAYDDLRSRLEGSREPAGGAAPDPLPRFELPHDHRVHQLEFGPSGRWLATVGRKELHLWDLANRGAEQSEPVSFQHPQEVRALAFSPDGRWVVTAAGDRRIRLWASERELLFEVACRTAGRNLTQEEWREFLPDESYRKTCQDLAGD